MRTRHHTPTTLYAVIAVGWILAGPAHGQDTHYWTEQYGARSMLLSGAVVGSVNDMSAVFCNPGALGYRAKPELLLSASAYQLRKLEVKGGGGNGVDLGSSKINLIPNLFAGSFRFNFHGPNKLAYSVLTRYRFDAELEASRIGELDLNPDIPGDETTAGLTVTTPALRIGAVGAYDMLELQPFVSQETGELVPRQLQDVAATVINVAWTSESATGLEVPLS